MSSNHRMVTSAARKSAPKKKNVRHMHIEKADNGYLAETHYNADGDGEKAQYVDPERKVFNSHKELADHVMSTFGGEASPAADEKGKKKGKPAPPAAADEEDDEEEC